MKFSLFKKEDNKTTVEIEGFTSLTEQLNRWSLEDVIDRVKDKIAEGIANEVSWSKKQEIAEAIDWSKLTPIIQALATKTLADRIFNGLR